MRPFAHVRGNSCHFKLRWIAQILLGALCLGTSLTAKPTRIISLDTATDTLVLQLADQENMLAVRNRTKNPNNSTQWAKASKLIGLHREMAEEVFRLRPDLVFFGQWSGKTTRDLLMRLNIPVCRLLTPKTWEDVFTNISEVGELVDEQDRASTMITDLQQRLAVVAGQLKGHRKLRGIYYLGRGHTYGSECKHHFVMESAGIRNIAAESGMKGLGKMSIEELLLSKPDIIIFSGYHKDTPTLSRQVLDHPAFKKLKEEVIITDFIPKKMNCMDASLVDSVESLARLAYPDVFGITPDSKS